MTAVSYSTVRDYVAHARIWTPRQHVLDSGCGEPKLDHMTPEELIGLAIDVADEGLIAGEMPVGAVVVMGEEIIGRAHTREKAQGRRLVHADLLAMQQADQRLGWTPRTTPLALAVNLEPCLMCLGTAMSLGVTTIYYGLEAPSDGAAGIATVWQPTRPDMPFSQVPQLIGGIRRLECRTQFARYVATAPESGPRSWAQTLADLPD
jgi:tRNA(adenine34) deaminase